MEQQVVFYVLFEVAEDGVYGDILVNRKLYTAEEVQDYVREHATKVYSREQVEAEDGILCYFEAPSQNDYGMGQFYFQAFSPSF